LRAACAYARCWLTPPTRRKNFSTARSQPCRRDYDKAEQGFQAVLKQEPRNVSALGNLGVVYSRIGRSDQAIEVYRRALEVSPDDEAILLNLGLAYFKQDAHAQALPSFAKVVAIDPRNLQARELLAVCRVYLRDPTPAIQDLEALRASNPNDQNVLFLLGFAYLRSHDAAKAKAIFQLMLEAVGPVQAQFLAGESQLRCGVVPRGRVPIPGGVAARPSVLARAQRTGQGVRQLAPQ